MSHAPDSLPTPQPLPRSVRAIAYYLTALLCVAAVCRLLGLPDPWGLAVQWVNAAALVLGAIALFAGLFGITASALK